MKIEELVCELTTTLEVKINEIQNKYKLTDEDFGKMIGATAVSILISYLGGFEPEDHLEALNQVIYHIKKYIHME